MSDVALSQASKELTRALVAAWNSKNIDEICAFFHDDFVNEQAPLEPVRGVDAYRAHLQRWFSAYPDLKIEITTLFAEGELVCLETSAWGTPSRSFFGIEAGSGRKNRALDILELRDGKVWRERGYWDFSLWTGHPSPLSSSEGRTPT